jgi:hypothetical protein
MEIYQIWCCVAPTYSFSCTERVDTPDRLFVMLGKLYVFFVFSFFKEKEENELKEQRYKRLMHLLTRSQFYTQFMVKKLESQKDEVTTKR